MRVIFGVGYCVFLNIFLASCLGGGKFGSKSLPTVEECERAFAEYPDLMENELDQNLLKNCVCLFERDEIDLPEQMLDYSDTVSCDQWLGDNPKSPVPGSQPISGSRGPAYNEFMNALARADNTSFYAEYEAELTYLNRSEYYAQFFERGELRLEQYTRPISTNRRYLGISELFVMTVNSAKNCGYQSSSDGDNLLRVTFWCNQYSDDAHKDRMGMRHRDLILDDEIDGVSSFIDVTKIDSRLVLDTQTSCYSTKRRLDRSERIYCLNDDGVVLYRELKGHKPEKLILLKFEEGRPSEFRNPEDETYTYPK